MLDLAVLPAHGLVLVEDGPPGREVAHAVVDDERHARRAVGVALALGQLGEARRRLALDAAAGHRLGQRRVGGEGARGLDRREVDVHHHAVAVARIPVDAMLDGAVPAPHVLVLVEHGLPRVEVLHEVMDDQNDHGGGSSC